MDGGSYAEMIEIPVSTCEMVVTKKRRKDKFLRKKVIDKVNKSAGVAETCPQTEQTEKSGYNGKIRFKLDVVALQVAVIFLLVVGIFVTNIFWEDSGINNLLKGVFNKQEQVVDTRTFADFSAFAPSASAQLTEDGVFTIGEKSAIYAPCQGVVEKVDFANGKYTLTISHSDNFSTIIQNADYAYFDVGETVYQAVPCGYSIEGGASVAMYNAGSILSNFEVQDGAIIWQN